MSKTIEQQWTELDERREALAAEMGFAYVDSVDGKKLEIEALQERDRIAREEERERISNQWYKAEDIETRRGFIQAAEYRIKLQALTTPLTDKE